MKKIFTLLAIFSLAISFAQGETIEKQINSTSFNRTRTIKIHLPEGYKTDTVKKYPIAIVLDNDYLFDLYLGNSKVFAEADLAPQQIVVGIDTDYEANKDVSIVKNNGGLTKTAQKFYNYIAKEVVPFLEANLKTSPFLTIVGQGNAGNFLTHFLKEQQPIFNAYIAISPSFNKDTQNLFSTYNLKRYGNIDNTFFLYVSDNNLSSKQSDIIFTQLNEGITNLQVENIDTKFDSFENAENLPTSLSVPIPHALTQIFRKYAKISKEEYDEVIAEMAPLDAIEYLENRYIEIEYLYGTNLNVRMEDILAIEGIVMDQQDGDYLRVLGDFTMIKHPDSPLGEYYTGMFYELGKDYERADTYYRSGYGKMDPSDPNTDKFYQNIERITRLLENAPPQEELLPLEEEPLEDQPTEEELPQEGDPEQNNDE